MTLINLKVSVVIWWFRPSDLRSWLPEATDVPGLWCWLPKQSKEINMLHHVKHEKCKATRPLPPKIKTFFFFLFFLIFFFILFCTFEILSYYSHQNNNFKSNCFLFKLQREKQTITKNKENRGKTNVFHSFLQMNATRLLNKFCLIGLNVFNF